MKFFFDEYNSQRKKIKGKTIPDEKLSKK